MNKTLASLSVMLCSLALAAGCGDGKEQAAEGGKKKKVDGKHAAHVHLCPDCGQVKGSKECCKEGATVCPNCKVAHKGSPGCCNKDFIKLKDAGEKHIAICEKCGQIEGSGACCEKGHDVCPLCKKHKGSPGCVAARCPQEEKKGPIEAPDPKKNTES